MMERSWWADNTGGTRFGSWADRY